MPLAGVIIEHLEPELSRWLEIEYRSSARLARGKLIITNLKNPHEASRLSGVCRVLPQSVADLDIPRENLVVLDPLADVELSPEDFAEGEVYAVIGGILGDFPPRGRTRSMLTRRLEGARVRNLGPLQFPIDASVYVVIEVSRGRRLCEIEVVEGLRIELGEGHEVYLPYAYPVVGGKPLISRELVEYLRSESAWG